jgi:hypothetical protein
MDINEVYKSGSAKGNTNDEMRVVMNSLNISESIRTCRICSPAVLIIGSPNRHAHQDETHHNWHSNDKKPHSEES